MNLKQLGLHGKVRDVEAHCRVSLGYRTCPVDATRLRPLRAEVAGSGSWAVVLGCTRCQRLWWVRSDGGFGWRQV